MKRTILIMDDSPTKVWRVEKVAKQWGFEVKVVGALETAKEYLKENQVTAIVADGSCYLNEGKEPRLVSRAGEKLMEWLQEQKREIPVLGYSLSNFRTDYPYYHGQMIIFDKNIFQEFISSLKDQV